MSCVAKVVQQALTFNNNIKLTVFPSSSCKNFYSEYWRLLDNRNKDSKHFVVSGKVR